MECINSGLFCSWCSWLELWRAAERAKKAAPSWEYHCTTFGSLSLYGYLCSR